MKKPRSDSTLKTLPAERQADIATFALDHSLAETREWLRADGVTCSTGALSDWLSWYRLQERFRQADSSATEFKGWLATSFPAMSTQELDQRAGLMFQFQAVQDGDAQTWLAIASARQKAEQEAAKIAQRKEEMTFDREKFTTGLKKKIELGFDELEKSFKGNAEALKHFNLARDLVRKSVTVTT